jgi:predicted kinase
VRAIVVAVSGPSGSGKSTVAATLARRFGWARVDEAFDRIRPRPSLRFASQDRLLALELRLLDEEARRFEEAWALALAGRTVVADTPFLDPVSYTAGLLVLGLATPASFRTIVGRAQALARQRRLGLPDLTAHLSVAATTRRSRAAGDTARHPRAFRERHESVGQVEAALLVPWWRGRLPGRMRVVRAADPAASIAERIRRTASRTAPARDPCGAAARALEALSRLPAIRLALDGSGNLKKGTPSPRPPR